MSMPSVEVTKKQKLLTKKASVKENNVWSKFKQIYLGPIVAFFIFISIWQTVPVLLGLKHYILPKPTDVVNAVVQDWGLLWPAVQITVVESIMGFVVSAVIGIMVSVLLASSKMLERSIYPYAIILQTIPVVAVAPIVVIWFGAGFNSIVVISFLIGFFPVISNTLMGLNSVDKNMDDLFTLYNASKWQRMWKLRIPSALPYIMAGLKISCTLSIVGAIVGEYIAGIGGGKGGLGYSITVAAIQVKTPYLFACGIAAAMLGIGFYLLVSLFAKFMLRSWHESAMKVEK
ncbi:ABC transporter permease [Aquibacillus albus]|uniref:NitT/TauT family transport system permease protein n=1 Tax=Aquibacillus albus TaxID=1168171 RepID=A0ABS2MW35_9BACI|nr:ABC transporter permease [Aquibacillus albus]MBM7570055.1 NitT/TauT family transport system permease protein [Aquibacillus albus]